jgi:hypothetical protein
MMGIMEVLMLVGLVMSVMGGLAMEWWLSMVLHRMLAMVLAMCSRHAHLAVLPLNSIR